MWSSIKKSDATRYLGVLVPGDETAPPTKWWNHLYLRWFRWRKMAIFRFAYAPDGGYRVGFRDAWKRTMLNLHVYTSPYFRVRIGHEACTFFAVNHNMEEILIEFRFITDKDDLRYSITMLPLI
jgi:hypothetical protein